MAAATAAGTLALSSVAVADQIVNNLDTSVDAVAEIMALNVGGGTKTTQLRVIQTDDDGKNGCNFQGHESITVSVTSSTTSVATVSPSSLTFSACNDVKTLTVTPIAQGESTISLQQTANTTGDTFDYLPARFTANVAPAAPSNTAPSISVEGVELGGTYSKGGVPPVTCQVIDAEDGSKTFAATLSSISGPYASDGIGSQEASCAYTDAGGLKTAASKIFYVVDPSAPGIDYTLSPETPDGHEGWYISDVSLQWDVTDIDSPNSLRVQGCEDQTVTEDQAETTYSCSAESAGGPAGPVAVKVKRDATAPVVSTTTRIVAGTEGANGWYTSPVTVEFSAEDGLSGPVSETKQVTSSGEGEAVKVQSPAFTDVAGNTTPEGSVTKEFKIDTQAPMAPRATVDPAPNDAGWNRSDVVVHFSSNGDAGADGSGVASCSADVPVTAETVSQEITGTCLDEAGNESAPTSVTVMLDKTGPVVSTTTRIVAGTEGANGWYTSPVTVEFSAEDGLSGPVSETKQVTSSGEGEAVKVQSPAFTDVAGNTTPEGSVTKEFKIDTVAPDAPTFVGGPTGSTYYGDVLAKPTCTANDATSGLASCEVTGYSTAVGTHEMTATATDNAGNVSFSKRTYQVQAWSLKGFYAPVDMSGVWNTVKGGSTVPLKFEVFAAQELTNTSAIKSFATKSVTCPGASAPADEIEFTTTGGTSLRYDTTGGQFIQNWQTPKKPGTCYTVTMTTQDDSKISANFLLK